MNVSKQMVFLLSVCLLAGLFVSGAWAAAGPSAAQASFALPAPQKSGGAGVFDALASRASAPRGGFPAGIVSPEELSTILWAASGLNRGEKGWTVPMAMGREPYCKIYVMGPDGAFLYDWKEHALRTVAKGDARREISGEAFVTGAPYVLFFVADGKALGGLRDPETGMAWANVLVGAMTQNVYLAADALGIGGRYMASFKESAGGYLKLEGEDKGICIMPIGKR